ncbi:isoprenyl transferase [Solitalea canadensis]|uniref:Isoprenyl transferase n=1 Tax=Solitalea canadensis (strain ATCC 29591 / DSM 3403 / JCM 21819 / LMG 8368 / NBRC 15130 / NCIMB 12057 / USAM 9D) TaxID=929556 RepID=H8KP54_SOLCM|nr:isoprenyl transferase [Solitalea canadensis]AFD05691.1 undecaprenyl diphosphate synthase [Solitalea canadensis DSM 3403]
MSFKEKIDMDRLPRHVAVIMDGNGRWAKEKGKLRVFGHQNGVKAVRDTVEAATELGVEYLTLYAFSTENWNRPAFEVTALMELLVSTINKETKTLMENGVRLNAFGDLKSLPSRCYKELMEAIDKTSTNKRLTLNLALSYSARWELTQMAKQLAAKIENKEMSAADVNEDIVSSLLCTAGIPDPELLIRTSGEYRISNFMLWQIAYSELYFTDIFWPDFRREHLYEAIVNYQSRERRFGKTSEQVI